MVIRLVDFMKMEGITLCLTNLTEAGAAAEASSVNISSLVDAWLLLRNIEVGRSRVRTMAILKARGMAHSDHTQAFALTSKGIQFIPTPPLSGRTQGTKR